MVCFRRRRGSDFRIIGFLIIFADIKLDKMSEREAKRNSSRLEYNTEREKLNMPEYGRNILKMIDSLRRVQDRDKRNEQARSVIKAMELINPSVHSDEKWEQKLWDNLFIIADFNLDIDSPYPKPTPEQVSRRPRVIPLTKKPIKATHYGRNIENIIDLVANEPEGEFRDAQLISLATYMRQQYLIWNKDTVSDEAIFRDIEWLSDGRIKVPDGLELGKIASGSNFSKPGMNLGFTQRKGPQSGKGRKLPAKKNKSNSR